MTVQSSEMELRKLLAELTDEDVSEVQLDDDLVEEIGLDSLAGLRMLAAVEKRFGVRFADERLGQFRTMRHLLEVINSGKGGEN